MPEVRIGALTAEAPISPTWDSVWIGDAVTPAGYADWTPAVNGVGFEGSTPITTAILLCLFTDKRLPDDEADAGNYDRRGWHGDTFDVDATAGEREIGSLLWTLERSALNNDDTQVALMAEHYADDALKTLVDQRVVGRFDIAAETDKANGMLILRVTAYAPTGEQQFSGRLPIMQRGS